MAKRIIPRILPDGQNETKFLKLEPDGNGFKFVMVDNMTDAIKYAHDAKADDIITSIFQMLLHHGGEPGCNIEICEYAENTTTPMMTYDFVSVIKTDYIPF